jgi:hypothetical protein
MKIKNFILILLIVLIKFLIIESDLSKNVFKMKNNNKGLKSIRPKITRLNGLRKISHHFKLKTF